MGQVYRAYDPRLRRKIALKVLRIDKDNEATASYGALERILREARAAAALDRPNAVSVFDVGEVDGTPYIAMELVQGVSMRDYVGDPTVSYDRRVRWLVDIARALAAAHERGLVHRDVKPENVMVRDDGVIKVLDFGIAKRMKLEMDPLDATDALTGADVGNAITETVKGQITGTPRYLAPEQVTAGEIDGRTDQFAWGVLAYELLHGRPPWLEDKGVMHMLVAIASHHPPSLSRLVANLPAVVSATVMRALSKAPQDRFQTMNEVVAALEPFEQNSRRSVADTAVSVATTRTDIAPMIPPLAFLPKKKPPRHLWLIGAAAAVSAGIAALLAFRSDSAHREATALVTSASAPTRLSVTEQPPPASSNQEAISAFRAAMQAFRDGTFAAIRESLGRAVTLDPGLAAAPLRLAVFSSLIETDEPEAKNSYKRASQFRTRLSEHDQALLYALEPYFQRDPSDPAECERRVQAAVERFPDDAEMAFYLGWIRYDLGRLTSALEAFNRAIEIDPKFALAWSNKGGCQAYLGDFDGALKSLDRCLAISPQATESLWYRTIIFEQEGACAQQEEDARRWISKDPEDSFAYSALAKALFAQGRSIEAVRATLEQKWARYTPEHRSRTEALDRVYLDIAAGDFDAAEKGALDVERIVAGQSAAAAHAEPARILVEIYRETGRDARARAVADKYVKRKDAWRPANRVDDGAIASDPIPDMLSALVHSNAITPETFEERRQEWLRVWEKKTTEAFAHYVWVYAHAVPAETPDDAKAALAALPKYAPLPPFLPQTLSVAQVGQTYLLAGKPIEALPFLKKACTSCMALYKPIAHTRAHLRLGDALAATGDAKGACASYKVVLDRWGSEARSVTAREARARRTSLRCE